MNLSIRLGWHPVAAILVALALFAGVCIGAGTAYSQETSGAASCKGAHISDFTAETDKAGFSGKKIEGQYLKHFFEIHAAYSGASPKVMDLRPTYGLVALAPQSTQPGFALVVYFDPAGCYMAHAKMDLRLLKLIELELAQSNV